ncbi:MAG: hypothetical protein WC423_20110 [Vulcanimicrobiota bacterium]
MTPEQQYELLIRLDERTISIEEKVDTLISKADNGGWARCHQRESRIIALENKDKERKDTRKWSGRLMGGTVIVLALQKIWEWASGIITSL